MLYYLLFILYNFFNPNIPEICFFHFFLILITYEYIHMKKKKTLNNNRSETSGLNPRDIAHVKCFRRQTYDCTVLDI